MRRVYTARQWSERYKACNTAEERRKILGPPINLAAEVLGITRTRIHQLVKEDKLDSISVYNDARQRIAHFITQASLDRRRKYRYKRGQWRPGCRN
jgi:hypothetical protein